MGSLLEFEQEGKPEVPCWVGRPSWGQGVATEALAELLCVVVARPLYARAAKDDAGSLRVLERCGFCVVGAGRGSSNARGAEVAECLLVPPPPRDVRGARGAGPRGPDADALRCRARVRRSLAPERSTPMAEHAPRRAGRRATAVRGAPEPLGPRAPAIGGSSAVRAAALVRTERLRLRPWRAKDAEAFHRIWGDPQVVFWGPAKDVAESRAMLARVRARCAGRPAPVGWHAVVEDETGEIVGNVALQPAPFAPGDLEVGWHLRHDRWGRGYATEAARALMGRAFASASVARLVCAILPSNVRSQRVARRLGFGVVARDVLHGGLPHDVWAVGRSEFRAARSPRARARRT